MGKDTKIEWADHTFNPWIGCTKISSGCTNCYAVGKKAAGRTLDGREWNKMPGMEG